MTPRMIWTGLSRDQTWFTHKATAAADSVHIIYGHIISY